MTPDPEQRISELTAEVERLSLEVRMLTAEREGLEDMILRTLADRKQEAELLAELLDPKTPGEEENL